MLFSSCVSTFVSAVPSRLMLRPLSRFATRREGCRGDCRRRGRRDVEDHFIEVDGEPKQIQIDGPEVEVQDGAGRLRRGGTVGAQRVGEMCYWRWPRSQAVAASVRLAIPCS